jgi:hypothetical protein
VPDARAPRGAGRACPLVPTGRGAARQLRIGAGPLAQDGVEGKKAMVDAWMRVAVDMLHVFLHRRGGMGMGAFWGGGKGSGDVRRVG